IGIFALGKGSFAAAQTDVAAQPAELHHLIGFIAIFAAALTLSLFLYEIRGILTCHNLIIRGKEIEEALGVRGQFCVCMEQHAGKNERQEEKDWTERASSFFDAKLAACVIYSAVMTAWIFTALHFGFGFSIPGCTLWALLIGLSIGWGAFVFVKHLVAV